MNYYFYPPHRISLTINEKIADFLNYNKINFQFGAKIILNYLSFNSNQNELTYVELKYYHNKWVGLHPMLGLKYPDNGIQFYIKNIDEFFLNWKKYQKLELFL